MQKSLVNKFVQLFYNSIGLPFNETFDSEAIKIHVYLLAAHAIS